MDERLLNDLLECSVCLERLDTSSKVLPCQHTFCKKCLEEIVHTHKELRCPECRVLVEIGIDELPPNVLLMRILEGMRNVPHRSAVTRPYQHEVATANSAEPSVSSFSSHSRYRSKSATRQTSVMPELNQPYAIAKRDYNTIEPGDLSFKRGDVIFLRRKIEHNWYQGECNGVLGVFPVSHVQVMIPLPSQYVPQCKALYDFSKCHEDDEGCLHFVKGDIITVLRRIDDNWAEGKLEDRIGIFPISFVEMNFVAKTLMKTSFNNIASNSRDAPPTPTEESVPLISKEGSNIGGNSTVQNSTELLVTSLSPSSSSSSTSTATTSPTSSSESTSPSSPSTPPSSMQPAQATATSKRHSFTLGAQPPPYHAPPAVHRHSVEILKPDDSVSNPAETNNETTTQRYLPEHQSTQPKPTQASYSAQLEGTPTRGTHHRKRISVNDVPEMKREHTSYDLAMKQLNGNVISNFQRQSSLRVTKNASMHPESIHHPSLPAMYIAIYPYKPQKTDELELKIGSVYTVIERCQDGWFKGTSHPNQKCGVFPGNYVTPVKSLPVFHSQLRGMMHDSPSRNKVRVNTEVRAPAPAAKTNPISAATTVSSSNGSTSVLAPPELPARSASPLLQNSASQKVSATIWHVPVSQPHEKTSASSKNRSRSGANDVEVNASVNHSAQKTTDVKVSSKVNEKAKEKKEKSSVSLMRRLTSMKKSRSPPPTSSFSIDNPVFEDGSSVFVPVFHSRSDSCPSQLSYNTSPHSSTSTNNHASIAGGSQRVKHKQRSSLQNQFSRTFDGNPVTSSTNSKSNKEEKPVISHRKSSSLDTTLYDDRQSHKTKPADPPPRERFRCITPYPPNSDFELELRVGDIIYVHKKRDDGWYKGTLQRNGRTGLFPASFVEAV